MLITIISLVKTKLYHFDTFDSKKNRNNNLLANPLNTHFLKPYSITFTGISIRANSVGISDIVVVARTR